MTPDISGFLGTDPGAGAPPMPAASGENPLTMPEYPEAESAPEDAMEGGEAGDVDPDFLALAGELFPDWADEDFSKLQQLIDLRINSGGPPPGAGGF